MGTFLGSGVDRRRLIALAAAAPVGLSLPARAAERRTGSAAGAYRHPPMFVIEEYHLVKPGKRDTVVEYYRDKVLPVLRTYPGYLGFSVLNVAAVPDLPRDPSLRSAIGISADPILPHEGVRIDGDVRTDRQVNFHAALENDFNLIFHHHLGDETTFRSLIGHDSAGATKPDSLSARWRERYGTDIWDTLAQEYFVHMRNHYDVVYSFALNE